MTSGAAALAMGINDCVVCVNALMTKGLAGRDGQETGEVGQSHVPIIMNNATGVLRQKWTLTFVVDRVKSASHVHDFNLKIQRVGNSWCCRVNFHFEFFFHLQSQQRVKYCNKPDRSHKAGEDIDRQEYKTLSFWDIRCTFVFKSNMIALGTLEPASDFCCNQT